MTEDAGTPRFGGGGITLLQAPFGSCEQPLMGLSRPRRSICRPQEDKAVSGQRERYGVSTNSIR
ncbi:hypothetical protein SAMN04488567_2477 [Limimaricola pyoseonensis]|uniref:Uncharacterized protein n=1 Tax=Limimaricola pyoseonensis TaxID=521013 RepID=A0A1G7FLU0_9RHOB|nr:hypothetical protein SAMN04488567_2477 [Limimaricola pyoseonensis]